MPGRTSRLPGAARADHHVPPNNGPAPQPTEAPNRNDASHRQSLDTRHWSPP